MESVFLNHSVCSGWPDWIDLAGCFSVGMLIKCNRFKATAPNKCFCGNHRSSPFNSLHFLSSAGGLCIWLLLREGTPIILSRSMWSIYIKILLFLFETLSHLFPPKINKVCRDYSSSVLKWYVWAVGAAVVLVGYIHSLKLWKCALEIPASFRAYLQLSFKGLSPLFWRRAVWTTLRVSVTRQCNWFFPSVFLWRYCVSFCWLLFPLQKCYVVIATQQTIGGAEYKSNTLFNPTGRNRENRLLSFHIFLALVKIDCGDEYWKNHSMPDTIQLVLNDV